MSDLKAALTAAIRSVTRDWKQAKRRADRADRVSQARLHRLRYGRAQRVTIKEAAYEVMEEAYRKASANGQYYANARQIMYAARPTILAHCDAEEFDDVYFTQTLLKDYIEEHGLETSWKVVWDARGHFIEPHTEKSVPLGGAAVTRYLADWHQGIEIEAPTVRAQIDTMGPANRFCNVLYIEKEGFQEILTHAQISARWDIAIMSTKGNTVKAACDLIAKLHTRHVRIFVLHDFDRDGFKIVRTLRRGTRLAVGTPAVIDLGLRLADVQGLQSEPVRYSTKVDPRGYLAQCGATPAEREMLVSQGGPRSWQGERVEINAMTSDQLIAWLEKKFTEHRVKKLIPDAAALADAYKRAVFLTRVQAHIEKLQQELETDEIEVPANLAARVRAALKRDQADAWDAAVWDIAEAENKDLGPR